MDKNEYYVKAIVDHQRLLGTEKRKLKKLLDASLLTMELGKMKFVELEELEKHAYAIFLQFYKYTKSEYNPRVAWKPYKPPSEDDLHAFQLSEYYYRRIIQLLVKKATNAKELASLHKLNEDTKNVIMNKMLLKVRSRVKARLKILKGNNKTKVLGEYYKKMVKKLNVL